MSDNTIQLSTGQTARINEGRVEVVTPPTHHYCLMVEHQQSGELKACCGTYDELITFLKQLERLDYRLRSLERMPGGIPPVQLAS